MVEEDEDPPHASNASVKTQMAQSTHPLRCSLNELVIKAGSNLWDVIS